MKYFVALAIALILNAAANLLIKVGMQPVESSGGLFRGGVLPAIKTILSSSTLLIGLICFVVNAVFYMYALQSKSLKITLAYPIMVGGGYAIIAIVARFHPALSEKLSWEQMLGVGLILAGVLLIASRINVSGA